MEPLAIALSGCCGRMGQALLKMIVARADCTLVAALDRADSAALGEDAGSFMGATTHVPLSADIGAALATAEVLIDFTQPEATLCHVQQCRRQRVPIVIGTTGFNAEAKARISAAAEDIAIVLSPNMSVGVNLSFKLLQLAAQVLQTGYEVEIIEAHHRHKRDAPSGTALRMGEVVAQALQRDLALCATYGREGQNLSRNADTIGFATVRGGDIVGEHSVWFIGEGERLEISHKASNRATFASGALRAAHWLAAQPPGLYDMQDVLGLK